MEQINVVSQNGELKRWSKQVCRISAQSKAQGYLALGFVGVN